MKSEREKMLAGELYLGMDPELDALRDHCRSVLDTYNATTQMIANRPRKMAMIRELFAKTGEKFEIQPPFYCDYGCHIEIGDGFFANFNCIILDCALVTFGDNVLLGPNVQIYTATHPLLASERIKGPESARPISVGNNVWIGGGAIICPGVSIGDNVTVGAGAVVTKDVPSDCFVGGNPARVIKELK